MLNWVRKAMIKIIGKPHKKNNHSSDSGMIYPILYLNDEDKKHRYENDDENDRHTDGHDNHGGFFDGGGSDGGGGGGD